LRSKSGRKPGGQCGHRGIILYAQNTGVIADAFGFRNLYDAAPCLGCWINTNGSPGENGHLRQRVQRKENEQVETPLSFWLEKITDTRDILRPEILRLKKSF
jgi:hypothetical protein